jgi:hypothetical protein
MSIEKKSLINTIKTAKKANIVKEEVAVSGATASPVKKWHAVRKAAKKDALRLVLAKKR